MGCSATSIWRSGYQRSIRCGDPRPGGGGSGGLVEGLPASLLEDGAVLDHSGEAVAERAKWLGSLSWLAGTAVKPTHGLAPYSKQSSRLSFLAVEGTRTA